MRGGYETKRTFLVSHVAQVCHRVSTQPLPVRVSAVTGHGEFFDVGDPIPKHATLVVDGTEDPLVKGLRLERLCSAALSERARRRNEQVTLPCYAASACIDLLKHATLSCYTFIVSGYPLVLVSRFVRCQL